MKKDRYDINLNYLRDRAPNHPLLPTLERGHSFINARYLQKALDKLPEDTPEPEPTKSKEKTTEAPKDKTLKGLQISRSKLYTERARLSNRFHDMNTDDARAANSQQIQIVQRQIQKLDTEIEYYQEYGKLPENKEQELYPLPNSALDIDRKIKSIRARISQTKKLIDKYFEQNDTAKIEKYEKQLSHLKNYLAYAENALKEKESA